jgi:hypothetical protein
MMYGRGWKRRGWKEKETGREEEEEETKKRRIHAHA